LMMPAQEKLARDLEKTHFGELRVPLVTNVDADTIETGEQARKLWCGKCRRPCAGKNRAAADREGVNTFVEVWPRQSAYRIVATDWNAP